jgi:cytochrome b subunit of formate dehydrogenase
MHNYFLIEHNYSQSVIYNFKSELKFWKDYNVVKIIIVMIIISGIIIKYFKFLFLKSV